MNGLKIVGLTILVLAVILGLKAFMWVFGTIIYYGAIATVVAILLYVYFSVKSKRKKGE